MAAFEVPFCRQSRSIETNASSLCLSWPHSRSFIVRPAHFSSAAHAAVSLAEIGRVSNDSAFKFAVFVLATSELPIMMRFLSELNERHVAATAIFYSPAPVSY